MTSRDELEQAARADANAAAYALCNGDRGSVPGRYQFDIENTLRPFFMEARIAAPTPSPTAPDAAGGVMAWTVANKDGVYIKNSDFPLLLATEESAAQFVRVRNVVSTYQPHVDGRPWSIVPLYPHPPLDAVEVARSAAEFVDNEWRKVMRENGQATSWQPIRLMLMRDAVAHATGRTT